MAKFLALRLFLDKTKMEVKLFLREESKKDTKMFHVPFENFVNQGGVSIFENVLIYKVVRLHQK